VRRGQSFMTATPGGERDDISRALPFKRFKEKGKSDRRKILKISPVAPLGRTRFSILRTAGGVLPGRGGQEEGRGGKFTSGRRRRLDHLRFH